MYVRELHRVEAYRVHAPPVRALPFRDHSRLHFHPQMSDMFAPTNDSRGYPKRLIAALLQDTMVPLSLIEIIGSKLLSTAACVTRSRYRNCCSCSFWCDRSLIKAAKITPSSSVLISFMPSSTGNSVPSFFHAGTSRFFPIILVTPVLSCSN